MEGIETEKNESEYDTYLISMIRPFVHHQHYHHNAKESLNENLVEYLVVVEHFRNSTLNI